ncbi:MAG: glycosyltransferase family 2 protein [Actinomycetota bacterium]
MPEHVAEQQVLSDLAGQGGEMREVASSLAAGAVLRGRMSPEAAAQLSSYTAEELRAVSGRRGPLTSGAPVLVSIVVPALNEEENLDSLWKRLAPVLDSLEGGGELVIVDDGSSDGTWHEIVRLSSDDCRVRGVRLSRNFGHQAALSAGMSHARGRTVCFMDADLQDPPELLGELLDQWRAGHEVVYAIRRSRQEGLPKRAAYRSFYRLYRRLANIDVPVDSGDFALLDRRVVDDILALPEHNRFLRGLRSWVGYRQIGVEYDRDARNAGEPKYTTRRLFRLALDGLLSFSAAPLRLASYLGIVVAVAGGIYIGVAIVYRLFLGGVPEGWTSIIAVVLAVGGMQLIVVGVLGEYVARVYDESKGRPNYLVSETTGSGAGVR